MQLVRWDENGTYWLMETLNAEYYKYVSIETGETGEGQRARDLTVLGEISLENKLLQLVSSVETSRG